MFWKRLRTRAVAVAPRAITTPPLATTTHTIRTSWALCRILAVSQGHTKAAGRGLLLQQMENRREFVLYLMKNNYIRLELATRLTRAPML